MQQTLKQKETSLVNEKEISLFCDKFNTLLSLINDKSAQTLLVNPKEVSKITLQGLEENQRVIIHLKNGSNITFYNHKDGFTMFTESSHQKSSQIVYKKNEGIFIISHS